MGSSIKKQISYWRLQDWLPIALCIQVAVVFFVPPLKVGSRQVFVSDLWCMGWLALAIAPLLREMTGSARKRMLAYFGSTGLLILAFYGHGYFRPLLSSQLYHSFLFGLKEQDVFQPERELVIAARFLSWLWAGYVVSIASLRSKSIKQIHWTLAVCLVIASTLVIAYKLSPSFRATLGSIYGFDPMFEYWQSRSYGAFQSPVEGSVALSLAGLVIICLSELSKRMKIAIFAFTFIAILLCKTMTVALGLALTFTFAVTWTLRKRLRIRISKGAIVAAVFGVGGICFLVFRFVPFLSTKVGDMISRMELWKLYLRAATSSWHLFLLGFGFAPYHADNSYVLFFTRGGIVALVLAVYCSIKVLAREKIHKNLFLSSVFVFIALIGFTLDAFIYRHAVSIFLATALPAVALSKRSAA